MYTFIQGGGITPFAQRTAAYAGGNCKVLAWIEFDNTQRKVFVVVVVIVCFLFFEYECFQNKIQSLDHQPCKVLSILALIQNST